MACSAEGSAQQRAVLASLITDCFAPVMVHADSLFSTAWPFFFVALLWCRYTLLRPALVFHLTAHLSTRITRLRIPLLLSPHRTRCRHSFCSVSSPTRRIRSSVERNCWTEWRVNATEKSQHRYDMTQNCCRFEAAKQSEERKEQRARGRWELQR